MKNVLETFLGRILAEVRSECGLASFSALVSLAPQTWLGGSARRVISLGEAGLPPITLTSPEASLSDVFTVRGHLKREEGQLAVGIFFLREREIQF